MKAVIIILISSIYSLGLWAQTLTSDGIKSRIIGGSDASELYPWMVSIQIGGHFCGGTLIGKDWVLTAAHCMEDVNADDLTLFIGGANLNQTGTSEEHSVEWFVVHPEYDSNSFYSDLAILKLQISSEKTPLPLLSQEANSGLSRNEQLRVIGWGLIDAADDSSVSNVLQEADVSFQTDDVCMATYSTGIENYWQRSLCAGEIKGGKDACQGDSGGPIVARANNQWALTGVVSWGDGCAEAGKFGAYTEVAFFQDWIEQRRRGVTLFGPDKIGFVGKGRSKPESYRLMNLGQSTATVLSKAIVQPSTENFSSFEIDEANWSLLEDGIPPGYECEFMVNALGEAPGEHDAQVRLDLDGYSVAHNLNAKVLESIPKASALDTNWSWFSGTGESTEHGLPWLELADDVALNASLLSSGNISENERSVLLSYLNGSGAQEPHYLKFDYKVQSDGGALLLYVNEDFDNRLDLLDTSESSVGPVWRTRSILLPMDINHILFIYITGGLLGSGSHRAFLDNLRVCTDANVESTCSTAAAFYNVSDLSAQDDPAAQDNWTNVCSQVDYIDSAINYAGRTSDDIIMPTPSSSSGGGGGGLGFLIFLVCIFLPRFKILKY